MLVVLAEVDCRSYLNSHSIYPNVIFNDLEELKQYMAFYTDVDLIILFSGLVTFHKRSVCEYIHRIREEQKNHTSVVNNLCVVSDTTLPKVDEYYKYTVQPNKAILHHGWDKVKGADFENPLKPFEGVTVKCETHFSFERNKLQLTEIVQKEMELLKVIKVPDLSDLKRKRGMSSGIKVKGQETAAKA